MAVQRDARLGRIGFIQGQKLLNNHSATKARLFFTSDGKGDQTPDKSGFAKKLQEGLLNPGGVDGILTSSDVWAALSRAAPTPHRGEFGSDEPGSSFLFIRQQLDIADQLAMANAWQQTKKQNTIAAYEAFLKGYPGSDFAALARQSIDDLRRLAKRRLPAGVFAYIDGGAEDERTLATNSTDFSRIF